MYTLSTEKQSRRRALAQHTADRVLINGRSLRYEAGFDICCITLQILREFVADDESDFFHCIHEQIECVRALVERGDALRQSEDGGEMRDWSAWLRDVAVIIPYLWD